MTGSTRQGGPSGPGHAQRLSVLSEALTRRLGLPEVRTEPASATAPATLVWTDGPTLDAVSAAARDTDPEAAGPLCLRRVLSEQAVALGAVRLATSPSPLGCGLPLPVTADAVEALWWEVPLPAASTPREDALVYALLYQAHDDHRRNSVSAEEICAVVRQEGIAPLLLRSGAELTPAEILTARYAATHAHPAWRHRLTTMPVPTLLRLVADDAQAPPPCLTAGLALALAFPEDDASGAIAATLRARLATPDRRNGDR
ncbi:hypothetical protein [Streptomyces abyssomicinicus]|uniref:hypothetical protein n=1 Tax=Streptomyces abyssomicinicus TaxID=574929 RepID=UPI001250A882|nr:hypothetical protein [Streptomyces abyssomicinicus]